MSKPQSRPGAQGCSCPFPLRASRGRGAAALGDGAGPGGARAELRAPCAPRALPLHPPARPVRTPGLRLRAAERGRMFPVTAGRAGAAKSPVLPPLERPAGAARSPCPAISAPQSPPRRLPQPRPLLRPLPRAGLGEPPAPDKVTGHPRGLAPCGTEEKTVPTAKKPNPEWHRAVSAGLRMGSHGLAHSAHTHYQHSAHTRYH